MSPRAVLQALAVLFTSTSAVLATIARIRSRPLMPPWEWHDRDTNLLLGRLTDNVYNPLRQLQDKIAPEGRFSKEHDWDTAAYVALDQLTAGIGKLNDEIWQRKNLLTSPEPPRAARDRVLMLLAALLAFTAAVLQIIALLSP